MMKNKKEQKIYNLLASIFNMEDIEIKIDSYNDDIYRISINIHNIGDLQNIYEKSDIEIKEAIIIIIGSSLRYIEVYKKDLPDSFHYLKKIKIVAMHIYIKIRLLKIKKIIIYNNENKN